MRADTAGRWRLSLLQVMKFVAFWAVAFGCVAPMLGLRRGAVVALCRSRSVARFGASGLAPTPDPAP